MGKLVSPRFVQVLSKTSRMRNSIQDWHDQPGTQGLLYPEWCQTVSGAGLHDTGVTFLSNL